MAAEDVNVYKLAKQVAKINLEQQPTRGLYIKVHLSSGTEYAYPQDDYKLCRKPPQACQHCGSNYHWDNDCPPCHNDTNKKGGKDKFTLGSKSSTAYHKAYEALTMGLEAEFSVAYTACVNYSDSSVDSVEEDAPSNNDNSVIPAYVSECHCQADLCRTHHVEA